MKAITTTCDVCLGVIREGDQGHVDSQHDWCAACLAKLVRWAETEFKLTAYCHNCAGTGEIVEGDAVCTRIRCPKCIPPWEKSGGPDE